MAAEGSTWNNLPSVILLEVFSYLSHEDKIRASSTCKHWRSTLYNPSFWQNIHFKAKTKEKGSIARTRFLINCFGKKLRNATISFDSMDPLCVQEAARILQQLCENDHLRGLILKPSHCNFECPGRVDEQNQYFTKHLLQPIQMLIERNPGLQALSLGCSEELTVYTAGFLEILANRVESPLRLLGLASVKDDPEDYILLDLDATIFSNFQMLQVLSVDYDYVSDVMLASLGGVGLKRFIIHVHGLLETHPGTSSTAWTNFNIHNSGCELRLNLIHSYEAVEVLQTEILKPTMPLTHFKAFFCEQFNTAAVHLMSSWYCKTLRSIWWIDSMSSPGMCTLIQPIAEEPDPLVMTAWRCKLNELVLLGYKYYTDNIVAIARLRGSTLETLYIPAESLEFDGEECDFDSIELAMRLDVSQSLRRPWSPLPNSELHDVIHSPILGDSDEFILPIVLRDQEL